MCTVALPVGCFGPVAPPRRTMMATYAVEAPPPAPCGYEYDDDAEIEGMFRDIDAFVHQPIPATTPRPMPSAEFLALSRLPDNDGVDFEVSIGGRFAALLAVEAHDGDTPTTPVADLLAPFSYGDDVEATACCTGVINTKTHQASQKKRPEDEPSWTYDSSIDATFRKLEKDPAERPSGEYLWTTQEGTMTMADRAELVTWMYELSRSHGVAPGTLHRAVSYVDRFLSAKKIGGAGADARDRRRLLGGAAVFAAAKYEDCKTGRWILNADNVARGVGGGCTRRQVLAAERDLVAALGYRLSGPTAYTFVDHFTRHDDDKETAAVIRSLAHHLADMTLLDFRCAPFLPSAVAASAILLARRVVDSESEGLLEMTGYTLEDLTGIIDAIYEMHELEGVWPGCAQMMANCVYSYSFPPR